MTFKILEYVDVVKIVQGINVYGYREYYEKVNPMKSVDDNLFCKIDVKEIGINLALRTDTKKSLWQIYNKQ